MPRALHPKKSSINYVFSKFGYVVPPAFPEVRQPMSECNFEELKKDAQYPTQFRVSNDPDLKPPSKEMCNYKYINCALLVTKSISLQCSRTENVGFLVLQLCNRPHIAIIYSCNFTFSANGFPRSLSKNVRSWRASSRFWNFKQIRYLTYEISQEHKISN